MRPDKNEIYKIKFRVEKILQWRMICVFEVEPRLEIKFFPKDWIEKKYFVYSRLLVGCSNSSFNFLGSYSNYVIKL